MSDNAALPWIAPVVERALSFDKAHALLLHGAAGDGLFEAAQAIAAAWLCEAGADEARPCGHCAACRLLAGGAHADLHRLLPEDLRVQLGGAGDGVDSEDGGGKTRRKPSRQIRIDEVRDAIDWIATTSARGRAKVVLVHPAEAMNLQSANALLKTLEEPPRGARLLLTAEQPDRLLPTVRSRCQVLRLPPPSPGDARAWLQQQGVAEAEVLLAAASQRPLEAAAMAAAGIDAARWVALPKAVLAGQVAAFDGWPLPRVLDALRKLCHDGLAVAVGAAPRFFPAAGVPRPSALAALGDWGRELAELARRIDHPWNEPLMLEALVLRAQRAWAGLGRGSDTLPG